MKSTEQMEHKDPKSYLQLPYTRVLIPEPDGDYSAEILEFPGCFAVGESPNEAIKNLEEIAESWIESMLEQGQAIPPPSANQNHSGKFALRLPKDLHRLAARKAARDGVSLNKYFVTAIAAWVGADNLMENVVLRMERSIRQFQVHVQFSPYSAQTPNSVLVCSGSLPPGGIVSTAAMGYPGSTVAGFTGGEGYPLETADFPHMVPPNFYHKARGY